MVVEVDDECSENVAGRPAHSNLWTARTHSDQIGQITASVCEFGLTNVILVDSSAGVIAGQGRLLAALELGITQLPVMILDHFTEAQKGPASFNNSTKKRNTINHPGWSDGESQHGASQFPAHRRAT